MRPRTERNIAVRPPLKPWAGRLSANISLMFTECDFIDRFAAAADAGFQAVEMQYPYGETTTRLAQAANESGVSVLLCNAPAGDARQGERGFACLPGRTEDFRASVLKGLDYAEAMGSPFLHVLSGNPGEDQQMDDAIARAIDNLAWAAEAADHHGVKILVEALNAQDAPGYLVGSPALAKRLVSDGRSETDIGPWLLFDVYHCAMDNHDPCEILRGLSRVAHIQIADAPGRGEPGTGRMDWDRFLEILDLIGYRDWLGCEYRPVGDTREGLNWREYWDRPRDDGTPPAAIG